MVYHYLKREAQIFQCSIHTRKTLLQKETNNCTKLSFQETKRNFGIKQTMQHMYKKFSVSSFGEFLELISASFCYSFLLCSLFICVDIFRDVLYQTFQHFCPCIKILNSLLIIRDFIIIY